MSAARCSRTEGKVYIMPTQCDGGWTIRFILGDYMNTDDVLRLLFPLGSLVGSLLQIATQIRTRSWNATPTPSSDLGSWYRAIIVVPLYTAFLLLSLIFLASLSLPSVRRSRRA